MSCRSRLLGYQGSNQPDDGMVPGGFATTIVREKGPGVPLSQTFFWNLDEISEMISVMNFTRVYE